MALSKTVGAWIEANVMDLGRQMRVTYLPPLMVYMAAGISGLTSIVGTFFVKDYLGLSAEFLAMLSFWAGIPWALKMPMGHLVDLLWRWKGFLIFLGAGLIAVSLAIMWGLIASPAMMRQYLSIETWYVVSALLAPIGYVVQDVVADAMTVEAVPLVDDAGQAYDKTSLKLMHTTMQTLGRVAIIGGSIAVSLVNIVMFHNVDSMTQEAKVQVYTTLYKMALVIPVISILGVLSGHLLRWRHKRALRRAGFGPAEITSLLDQRDETPQVNWWILGGSLVFVVFTLITGVSQIPLNQEIIFAGSMAIVLFLMTRLLKALSPPARRTLLGTAVIIFVFRAIPTTGEGATWWQIDVLGFDEQFLSTLTLIGSLLALCGMFIFRRFMAERSMAYVVGFLTLAGAILMLPLLGMYYGLHEWTAALTGGMVDARFIALVNTSLESPLGQVAMVPMLAWIANSAPANLKATFFAVMASFTNLALSLASLGTKYINQIFTITREVRDATTQAVTIPADYSQLGVLLLTVLVVSVLLPMLAIILVQGSSWREQAGTPVDLATQQKIQPR